MSVVAISRQVGSNGENIARLAADQMGMDLITRDRIHEFIIECEPDFAKACRMYEEEVPKSFWARNFFDSAKHAALFEYFTFRLASRGNAVLMGRGTPVVLRDRPDVFRVRIVAPFEVRARRIQAEQGGDLEKAEDFVRSYGRHRRNLIESIFRVDLSDPELYDLQINTAELNSEAAANILVQGLKAKMKFHENDPAPENLAWITTVKQVDLDIKRHLNPGFWQKVNAKSGGPGQVILDGYVKRPEASQIAEKLARNVAGINQVDNRLVVVNQE